MMNPGIVQHQQQQHHHHQHNHHNCEMIKPRSVNLLPSSQQCLAIGLRRNIQQVNHHQQQNGHHHSSLISTTFSSSLSMSSSSPNSSQPSSLLDKVSITSSNTSSDQNHHHHHHNHHHHHHDHQKRPLPPLPSSSASSTAIINYVDLFNDLIKENQCLSSSPEAGLLFTRIQMVGFLHPATLLVTGDPPDTLETLCSLWSKRILKAPPGYLISFVGYTTNTNALEISCISQTHFTPLTEALLKCIDELNTMNLDANHLAIIKRLASEFPRMELPDDEILKTTLHTMTMDNRLNYDGHRQIYTVAGAGPGGRFASQPQLPPQLQLWDEFENISINDTSCNNNNNNNDSRHHQAATATFEEFGSTKSSLINTDNEDYSDLHQHHHNNNNNNNNNLLTMAEINERKIISLRNSSSLSNDDLAVVDMQRKKGTTGFRRSKSFKLNQKSNTINCSNQDHNDRKQSCTCQDMIIKRQTLLGKLFKLNSNSTSASKTPTPRLPTTLANSSEFGSQFPEIPANSLVMYNNNNNNNDSNHKNGMVESESEDRFSTKSTQTVKSGPEEIITVVMRQVGKHALSRKRYGGCTSREKSLTSEECCHNRFPRSRCSCEPTMMSRQHHHHHHHQLTRENGLAVRINRNRHRNNSISQNSSCSSNEQSNRYGSESSGQIPSSDHSMMQHHHHLRGGRETKTRRHLQQRNTSSTATRNHNPHHHHHHHHHHHLEHHNPVRSGRNDLIDYMENGDDNDDDDDDDVDHVNQERFPKQDCYCSYCKTSASHIDDLNGKGGGGGGGGGSRRHKHLINNHNPNDNDVDDKCFKLFHLNEAITIPRQQPTCSQTICKTNGVLCPTTANKINGLRGEDVQLQPSQEMVHNNNNNSNHHHHHHHHHSPPALSIMDPCVQTSRGGKVLINNSVSVKIEIETSNVAGPATNNVGQHHNNNHNHSLDPMNQRETTAALEQPSKLYNNFDHHHQQQQQQHHRLALRSNKSYKKQPRQTFCLLDDDGGCDADVDDRGRNIPDDTNTGTIFANDIYHEFDFGADRNRLIEEASNNRDRTARFEYPPELNYANSVTALKEQIARAKANFFKESFAS